MSNINQVENKVFLSFVSLSRLYTEGNAKMTFIRRRKSLTFQVTLCTIVKYREKITVEEIFIFSFILCTFKISVFLFFKRKIKEGIFKKLILNKIFLNFKIITLLFKNNRKVLIFTTYYVKYNF